jgi:hypothetical protein
MNRSASMAAGLPKSEPQKLTIQALSVSETLTDLATEHGVSRKCLSAQRGKASDECCRNKNGSLENNTYDKEYIFI